MGFAEVVPEVTEYKVIHKAGADIGAAPVSRVLLQIPT